MNVSAPGALALAALTGMPGTGKPGVIRELAAPGHNAADTGDGWCDPLPDGRQRWQEEAITALPDTGKPAAPFTAG